MHTRSINKKLYFLAVAAVLLILLLVLGIRWVTYARPPLQEAVMALESDSVVTVSAQSWLTFSPAFSQTDVGLIFYPGGRINPQGYSSLLRPIAEKGILVVVPEMPLNMAAFNPNVADKIMSENPQIRQWFIAGHSVGGTMAAQYAINNPEHIEGVIVWASYPAKSDKLKETTIPILTIFGSEDPRVNDESLQIREEIYPDHAEFIRINGGDHHQFGAYEITPAEYYASISPEEQHNQIIDATLTFISTHLEK